MKKILLPGCKNHRRIRAKKIRIKDIMMKKFMIISVLSFVVTINSNAQNQQAEAWKQDLDYLVQRIEIMHPNPYAQIPKEEFTRLTEKIRNEITDLSDVDIVISISELLATLQDGHTGWAMDKTDPVWLQQSFHLLPLIQYEFKDGIYVMAGLQPYEHLVGLKVMQIGNMPIQNVAGKLSALMSHDNRSGGKKYLYYSLCMAEMLKKTEAVEDVSNIQMVLQNDRDEKITVEIPTVDLFSMVPFLASSWYPQAGNGLVTMNQEAEGPLPLWLKKPGEKFWFEYIPEDKTMFLQINSLNFPHGNGQERSPFGKLCDQFFESFDQNGAEKLVIDIRTNTGGNHVELPLLEGIMARPQLNKPDRLFLITGRVTFSAAVHLTSQLKRYTNITLTGEPPSGRPNHYGANRAFNLPNHPQIVIQSSIDYYQDAQPFNFNTIHAPDIYAEMTAADYRENVDPAMQAVKNYDRIISQANQLRAKLEHTYAANGIPGVREVYFSNKPALIESGYNLEKFFKEFYYGYLTENKQRPADLSNFLALTLSECPGSIDLTYMLALQLECEGRLEEAKQQYKRCLELNPEHHYARMKLELLGMESIE